VEILAESKDWHRYDLPSYLADKIWDGRFRGQTQKWFAMEFLGEDSAIKPSDVDKPEFSEWRWVELELLPSLAISFKKEIYQSIAEEFSALANTLRANYF
jgi:putative (di)nucleoside polyphosphate hydrolase